MLKPGVHQIAVQIPEELYVAIKAKLDREGHTLSWIIRRFLLEWVEEPKAVESQ
jgi:hypothetical protein